MEHSILQFIQHYGYWIAVPIMIIEGPIITLVMGALASFGYFNPVAVAVFGFTADLVSDTFWYWSGYHGGDRVLARLKIPQSEDNKTLQRMKDRFESHPGKIFFGAKVLPGITSTTMVLAGAVKTNYLKVLRYSVWGGMIWSAALTGIGYFFGRRAAGLNQLLSRAGIVFFILLALFLFYEFWFGRYLAKKIAVWRQNNGD
jgi:membrane protein DedA with SNARE-associated domain